MSEKIIKAGIIGARGFVGAELVELLLQHPNVELKYVFGRDDAGKKYADKNRAFAGMTDLSYTDTAEVEMLASDMDVAFLAMSNGQPVIDMVKLLDGKCRVIDISGTYRLQNPAEYEEYYEFIHTDVERLPRVPYGLPEAIKSRPIYEQASVISNPGCFATATELALLPLVSEQLVQPDTIIVDALTGLTGGGTQVDESRIFVNKNENATAYKIAGTHQHVPEINQVLTKAFNDDKVKIMIEFTPKSVPMDRGILATCYATISDNVALDKKSMTNFYKQYYADAPFVNIYDKGVPQTKYVQGKNRCDISIDINPKTGRIIVNSVIDNLVKGAAGQAVQNMNLMMGLKETAGLIGGRKIR